MPSTSPNPPVRLDAQVLLSVHPAHPTAAVARLTGSRHRTAQALLTAHGFDSLDERTMVLARIAARSRTAGAWSRSRFSTAICGLP
ncbi:hypothetical protein [Streptomyces sp. NPDC047042]|uniref:hypothetical protein n=1 Tax=Streptomyces sp. NPDC047042 TaxID=3154807 RepID=UPI0034077287